MKLQTPIIVALGAVAGLLLAQTETEPPLGYEWEMFSQRVAGYDGGGAGGQSFSYGSDGGEVFGITFVFNKRTGRVYRFFTRCDDEAANGCFVALPAYDGSTLLTTPSPQTDGGNLPLE